MLFPATVAVNHTVQIAKKMAQHKRTQTDLTSHIHSHFLILYCFRSLDYVRTLCNMDTGTWYNCTVHNIL
jgi:hypothetical protein